MEILILLDGVVEFSEGLFLVFCIFILFFFVCVDVFVCFVDEWKLKEGLIVLFKKIFGLMVVDWDFVV